ncbi:MAG: hypothetical protein JMN27_12905 [gamma proteobacterium endosymbiont of Lamellibrachia anaximandri]|nr:hypothetical protein [gamma proteobacterium endosymbiont of Lamellibrachia anaximandri]MBL3534721.1 hypothetical protein [gamma proteobacterium endosymbiont of Lamellibrachia anaximandri]
MHIIDRKINKKIFFCAGVNTSLLMHVNRLCFLSCLISHLTINSVWKTVNFSDTLSFPLIPQLIYIQKQGVIQDCLSQAETGMGFVAFVRKIDESFLARRTIERLLPNHQKSLQKTMLLAVSISVSQDSMVGGTMFAYKPIEGGE